MFLEYRAEQMLQELNTLMIASEFIYWTNEKWFESLKNTIKEKANELEEYLKDSDYVLRKFPIDVPKCDEFHNMIRVWNYNMVKKEAHAE